MLGLPTKIGMGPHLSLPVPQLVLSHDFPSRAAQDRVKPTRQELHAPLEFVAPWQVLACLIAKGLPIDSCKGLW